MNEKMELKTKDNQDIQAVMKVLDESYIEKIMDIQNIIINALTDKELYAATTRDRFLEYINGKGKIIGVVDSEDNLVAMGVYVNVGFDRGNYGYDLDITGDDLLNVCQIESTVVLPNYRGNRLQTRMCKAIEEIAKENGTMIITATASPYNQFSVDTFVNLGYEITKDIIKYGGLRRYVFAKELFN